MIPLIITMAFFWPVVIVTVIVTAIYEINVYLRKSNKI